MPDKNNPISDKDKAMNRQPPELESDNFSIDEQKEIVQMVTLELEQNKKEMNDWVKQREQDLKEYNGEPPSKIENLTKEAWQSDRNLRLCTATNDATQATLVATCYNPDMINWIPTEKTDGSSADNLRKFTKWGLGSSEANFYPEVNDFIHNRVVLGTSYFTYYWDVEYKWVDVRIPKYKKPFGLGRPKFDGYDVKTVLKRFEKGLIENIDNLDDLLMPSAGDSLQNKQNLIHVIHTTYGKIVDNGERGIFQNVDEEYKRKIQRAYYDKYCNSLDDAKKRALGLNSYIDVPSELMKGMPIDIYARYGKYKKNGKDEEYRLIVDISNKTFLSGKPIRKVNRKGKRPFVGGGLLRRPGVLQGESYTSLISDCCNTFNNIWNQKSDFQYVNNCPFGIYNPDEHHMKDILNLAPGKMYPSSDPNSVVFPNLSRSLAWAMQDFEILYQQVEKLTGAASYFLSTQAGAQDATATRDAIIAKSSETRFGLMVKLIVLDISEVITDWMGMYQDWAPPDLGERVLGEDGKQIFDNFSIETIMGGYDCVLQPDIIAGSRQYEREMYMWAINVLSQSVWFMPQLNPSGNWELWNRAAKKYGISDVDNLMPPKPEPAWEKADIVQKKWAEIKQGHQAVVKDSDDIITLFQGFNMLKERRFELDEEYRPLLDNFMVQLNIAMHEEQRRMIEEQVANNIAMANILNMKANMSPQDRMRPKVAGEDEPNGAGGIRSIPQQPVV